MYVYIYIYVHIIEVRIKSLYTYIHTIVSNLYKSKLGCVEEPQKPKGSGDDLRAFLEEAKAWL